MNGILILLNVMVDWVRATREKLLKAKKPKIGDLINAFDEGASSIAQTIESNYFSMLKMGNPDSERELRKRKLLAKARQRTISYSEAEELRRLLEEQKRQYEALGNIIGAILVGLLIIFLLGVIASLRGEGRG